MKKLGRLVLLLAAALLLTAAPARPSFAQAAAGGQPVAVVSIANLDSLMANLDYLAEVGGVAELGAKAKDMAQAFTAGLDTTKPMGAFVGLSPQGMPTITAFVPVTNLQTLLETHKDRLGEPRDAGNGVLLLGGGQPMFLREQGGWAFLSNAAENLAALPPDPTPLLDGLDQQYSIAVRVHMQNIPQPLRQMAVMQMQAGMNSALERQQQQPNATPVDPKLTENLSRNMLQSIAAWIQESDQITIGWAVDIAAKSTYLDVAVKALAGTGLAERMASMQESASGFSGFLMPEAAATLHSSSTLAKEDIEQMTMLVKMMRDRSLAELDKDANLPDEQSRAVAKEVVGSVLDVALGTIEQGKLDGGAVLLLAPRSISFAAGALVSDGTALDQAFRKLVEIAKDEPDFPQVTLDAAKVGEIAFHTVVAPIPDEQARQILGDQLQISLGFGQKSVYLALGADSLNLVKQIMEKSALDAAKMLPASQFKVSLGPILEFAASVEANPTTLALSDSLKQSAGADNITVVSHGAELGGYSRVEIQEGVLRLIGQAVRMMMGAN